MKKYFLGIIFFMFCAALLSSCDKSDTLAIATPGTAGTLSSSTNTLTLHKSMEPDTVIALNWAIADYGYPSVVSQTLQLALKGTDFANPLSVNLNSKTTRLAYTGLDFNALLLRLNLPFGSASDVDVRVASSISASIDPIFSNVVSLKVTPYPLVSWLYVPGAYQGWSPASADSLVSATGNGIYQGTILFTPGNLEFKITPGKTWDGAYGDGGGGTLSTSGGNLAPPTGGNYPGSYQIIANLNTSTYSIKYNQWSVIGDASVGGWSTDTDMKYNNGDSTWSVTTTLNASGKFKFRYNHDWGTNLGGSDGTLSSGGADIAAPSSGTYLIKLDVPDLKYTLTKQ